MPTKTTARKNLKSKTTTDSGNEFNIKTLKELKLGLDDVLDKQLNFQGSFSSEEIYEDFPNPCLNINNLGHIGLPLSQREAKTLISECQQAPVGKGMETVVDTEVRKTWQLDASMIFFKNPKWTEFLDTLLRDACKNLGVNYEISQPACELYKLLIYEPGSHFKFHQDTEKSPGMFATMVVILPSEFTGGDVHLKHADSKEVFECAENSDLKITALCWYTDVFHEVKPIKTGYRLALSYNLIHETKVPKPTLPSSDVARQNLEKHLKAWADGNVKSVPSKLLFLLQHEYSGSGLKTGISSLKGVDATRVALISDVGTPLGFKFALVCLEYYVSGYPEDSGSDTEDPDAQVIDDVRQEKIKFKKPVDLSGKPVAIELKNMDVKEQTAEDKTEFIPENLTERIRDLGGYHKYNYVPYLGNESGDIEQWYHKTVLVIWHESREDVDNDKAKRTRADDEPEETAKGPKKKQKRAKKST